MTCHDAKYTPRAEAQRLTWAPTVGWADVKFFKGTPTPLALYCPEDICLVAGDSYQELPAKVQMMCRYARAQGYDAVLKTDDDSYIIPERLLATCPIPVHDYVGNVRGATGGYPAPYASGFGYWLSERAMEVVANAELTDDPNEDRWVGNVLAAAGICAVCNKEAFNYATRGEKDTFYLWSGRMDDGKAAVFAEFTPENMVRTHKYFRQHYAAYCKRMFRPARRKK